MWSWVVWAACRLQSAPPVAVDDARQPLLSDPSWAEGDRVSLLVTTPEAADREAETLFAVRAVLVGAGGLALPPDEAERLRDAVANGAVLGWALDVSDAVAAEHGLPPGRLAMPLPGDPRDPHRGALRPKDRLDLYVTLGDRTLLLVGDLDTADGWAFPTPEDAERIAHAGALGVPTAWTRVVDAEHREVPLRGDHAARLAPYLRPGDPVAVFWTDARDWPEAETLALWQDLPATADGWVSVSPETAEKLVHAEMVGTLGAGVGRRTDPAPDSDPRDLPAHVPAGMVAVFARFSEDRQPAPFVQPGDLVDLFATVEGRAMPVLQATLQLASAPDDGADTSAVLLPPDHAERWYHAIHHTHAVYVLRNPTDTAFVATELQGKAPWPIGEAKLGAPRLDGPPAERIAHGARGFAVRGSGLAAGDWATVATDSGQAVLGRRAVLDAGRRRDGTEIVLLHVSPDDAAQLVLASAEGALVALPAP